MVLAGAGGHAREIIDILPDYDLNNLFLFDDFTDHVPDKIFGFCVINSIQNLKNSLFFDSRFVLATGSPNLRRKMYKTFLENGGICTSIISQTAQISNYNVMLGLGLNLMSFVQVSNSVSIGEGSLINSRVNIHHDVSIGEFCEIGPGSILLGNSSVGSNTIIGAGAIILPNVKIGNNCLVAAGAVVTKNLNDGMKAKGVPADLF